MAASCVVGRFCTLARSRVSVRTCLPRPQQPWSVRAPQTVVCSRLFSQEEPASGYRYAKSHEWASTGDPSLTTIGVSNYAQEKLGDVVFVELPEVGAELEKGDILGVLESVKAAADIYTPVGGTVAEINSVLTDSTELVNSDPYEEGWLIKLKDVSADELNDLMSVEDYKEYLETAV